MRMIALISLLYLSACDVPGVYTGHSMSVNWDEVSYKTAGHSLDTDCPHGTGKPNC